MKRKPRKKPIPNTLREQKADAKLKKEWETALAKLVRQDLK